MQNEKNLDKLLENLDNEEYHADRTAFSSSVLKTLLKDKVEFYKKYILGESDKIMNKSALDLGSYVHAACLEPHLLEKEFAVYTGTRRGVKWDMFQKENEGKTIITNLQKSEADLLVEAFNNSKLSTDLIKSGKPEISLFTSLHGHSMKVRADWLDVENGIIMDIKTTSSILTPHEIQKVIAQFHYDLSAKLYVDAFSKALDKPFDFYFVFLSKKGYKAQVVKASTKLLDNGARKIRKALKIYNENIENNGWLHEEIMELGPAVWDDYELKEMEGDVNDNV